MRKSIARCAICFCLAGIVLLASGRADGMSLPGILLMVGAALAQAARQIERGVFGLRAGD